MNSKKKAKKTTKKQTSKLFLVIVGILLLAAITTMLINNSQEQHQEVVPIIKISQAWHLDQNKSFIKDITDILKEKDNQWTKAIKPGEYLRVTFTEPLDSSRDITIHVKNHSNSGFVEVYLINSSKNFARFPLVQGEGTQKIYLTDMTGEHQQFDLKIVGGSIIFDQVIDPLLSSCANLNTNGAIYNLTSDILAPSGSCINISAHNVVLDCKNYNISYNTDRVNHGGRAGINATAGYHNITIKNCVLSEYSGGGIKALVIDSPSGNVDNFTFINNTIVSLSTFSGNDIIETSNLHNSTFANNTLRGRAAAGIELTGGANNTFIHNHIDIQRSGGLPRIDQRAILLQLSTSGNIFKHNIFNSSGLGLYIFSGRYNMFENNTIYGKYAYILDYNKISASGVNRIIYNNTFGEIKWFDNGAGSFLRNLSLNFTNNNRLALGKNLHIRNNTASLNVTAQSLSTGYSRINGTANITLKRLGLSSVTQIIKYNNFTANSTHIINNGTNCAGSTCTLVNYASGILRFNTNSFSSFAGAQGGDVTIPKLLILYPSNNTQFNSTNTSVHRIYLNFSATDETTISTCWYNLNEGANITMPGCANVTINPIRGKTNLTLYINDTSNNINFTRINFTVNQLSTISSLILNSTDPTTNGTNQNLTIHNTSSDADGDQVKLIYNWYVNDSSYPDNGRSLTVLNMPFERINGTNTNNTHDYSGYNNYGIITNEANNATWNETGGLDGRGAYKFDGVNDFIHLSSGLTQLNGARAVTVSLWAYKEDDGNFNSYDGLFTRGSNGVRAPWILSVSGTQNVSMYLDTSEGSRCGFTGAGTMKANGWNHVVGRWNGSLCELFLNGVRIGSAVTLPGVLASFDGVGPYIGKTDTFDQWYGSIDEVLVFNRSLSTEEVWNLYTNKTWQLAHNETQAGDNWTVVAYPNDGTEDGAFRQSNQLFIAQTPDTTFPLVTILNPANNTNFSTGNQSFNVTILEENIGLVLFSLDNATGNGFNITTLTNNSGNWNTEINVSQLAEGTHIMTIFANDTINNLNNTVKVYFTIDRTIPQVTFLNPANGTNTSTGLVSLNASVIDTLTAVSQVIFMFNTNGTPFNLTTTNVSGNWNTNINISTLSENTHIITIFVNDSVNNVNQTITRTIHVDRTAPTVNILNTSFTTSDTTPDVWFNFTDLSVSSSCTLYVDSTAQTTSQIANNTNTFLTASTLAAGDHITTVNCTDGSGNKGNSSAITVTIQSTSGGNSGGGSPGGGDSSGGGDDTSDTDDNTDDDGSEETDQEPEADTTEDDIIIDVEDSDEPSNEKTTEGTSSGGSDSSDNLVGEAFGKTETTFINREPINQPQNLKVTFTNRGKYPLELTPSLKEDLPLLQFSDRIQSIINERIRQGGPNRTFESLLHIERENVQYAVPKTASFTPSQCIQYSEELILGRLLPSKLINAAPIVIQPNQTIEQNLQIQPGITRTDREVNLVFSTKGKEIIEKKIKREKLVPGVALDLIKEYNLLDFYVLVPPTKEATKDSSDYKVEVDIQSLPQARLEFWQKGIPMRLSLTRTILYYLWGSRSTFTELYGSYKVNNDESFIAAQQFFFSGSQCITEKIFVSRVYRDNIIISENAFRVNFAAGTVEPYELPGKEQKPVTQNQLTIAAVFDYQENITLTEYNETTTKVNITNHRIKAKTTANLITGLAVDENIQDEENILSICLIALLFFIIVYTLVIRKITTESKIITRRIITPADLKEIRTEQKETMKKTVVESPITRGFDWTSTIEKRRQQRELSKITEILQKSSKDSAFLLRDIWKEQKNRETPQQIEVEKIAQVDVERISRKITGKRPQRELERIEEELQLLKQGILKKKDTTSQTQKRVLTEEILEEELKVVRKKIFKKHKQNSKGNEEKREQQLQKKLEEITKKIQGLEKTTKPHIINTIPSTRGIEWLSSKEKRVQTKELSTTKKRLRELVWNSTDLLQRLLAKQRKEGSEKQDQQEVLRISKKIQIANPKPLPELQRIERELKRIETEPIVKKKRHIVTELHEKDIQQKVLEKELQDVNRKIHGYHQPIQILSEPKNAAKLQRELKKIEVKLAELREGNFTNMRESRSC